MTRHPARAAFTLLELAVVIVIIGLLVGAVVGGTSLLKQSELQGVVNDYTKYTAAVNTFRQQYGGWPGDLLDATSFWNSGGGTGAETDATCKSGITMTATCNGDNDGNMSDGTEPYLAWHHLMLAKLIKGTYSGIDTGNAVPGTNVPKAIVKGAAWTFGYKATTAADAAQFDQSLSNFLAFGTVDSTIISGDLSQGASIKPEDAWQIDSKLDDGTPAYGRVVTLKSTELTDCADSDTDATAVYERTVKGKTCSLNMSLTLK